MPNSSLLQEPANITVLIQLSRKPPGRAETAFYKHQLAYEFHPTGSVFQPALYLGTASLYMRCLVSENITEKAGSRFMFEIIPRKGIFYLHTRSFASPRS